jgi:hypothetical protein
MIFLSFFLLFQFYNCFAQNNENSYDDIFQFYGEMEKDRLLEQSKIRDYEDLECTFWTPEVEYLNDSFFDTGYVFLPNNTVLITFVVYRPVIEETPTRGGVYNIYNFNHLSTYEIIDDKIIVGLGIPIMYLKDNSLYISYDDGNNFKKYRFEQKFNNYIDIKHSQFLNEKIEK